MAGESSDVYLIKRTQSTTNLDSKHLLEVDGVCPLCGKYLIVEKGIRTHKKYEIAHIYPNSPTVNELKILLGVERLGINCEDFENKIALCKECHGEYDDNKTLEEYLRLLKYKKRFLAASKSKVSISNQILENEIVFIIDSLSNADFVALQDMKLEYHALKISSKIEDKYSMLRNKIEMNVYMYFNLIKETFKDLDSSGQVNFNIISSQIKTSFLQCEKEIEDKSEIFKQLVRWMNSKCTSASNEACEAVISYFVQNCEVFNEITQ
ncbi:hypothetical protein QWJ34_22625 [Saccharibacillus sp. CPCC 101409]|uniref:ABC-three component system protein n=1 Tax=Saccharibacillus sp. CPCC 101409 TaxID=3058041 RepID=UPI0026726D1A|nr:ABC-three component system protein [Saccharibacillus sp. CPCC 101409]MDO3412578.1 hypothetical protein [Saccharibacillus sp. CPCC 101409]